MFWNRAAFSWQLALVTVFWYALIRISAFEMAYIEGDDASIVVHHALGRDSAIQKPFAIYQMGFDYLLGLLPANEHVVKTFAYEISFASGWLMFFLIGRLLMSLLPESRHGNLVVFMACLPIIQPEWIFNTLTINPTNLGMVLCLTGLFGVYYIRSPRKWLAIGLASCFFALGIFVRWSLLSFAPLVLLYYWALKYKETKTILPAKRDALILLILPMTVLFLALILLGAGLHPKVFPETILWGINYDYSNNSTWAISQFVFLSSWATPAFVLLAAIGFLKMTTRFKFYTIGGFALAAFPFFISGWDASFKYLITLFPILTFLIFLGFERIIQKQGFYRILFLLALSTPWLVGLRLNDPVKGYGPGFERYDVPQKLIEMPDRIRLGALNLSDVQFTWKSGLALPSIEGVRPLWGYADALIAGGWRQFYQNQEDYMFPIIAALVDQDSLLILQDGRSNILKAWLLKHGFSFTGRSVGRIPFEKWIFEKADKKIILWMPINASTPSTQFEAKPDFLFFGSFSKLLNFTLQDADLANKFYHNSWLVEVQ